MHSPFLYSFYTDVIKNDHEGGFEQIEALREDLLKNNEVIKVDELGAGSRIDNGAYRKLADIARHASTPASFSRLLYRIIKRHDFKSILELGTSLGLNTLHMQKACPDGKIYTLEGSSEIAQRAQQHFHQLKIENIKLVEGNIDDTLSTTLKELKKVDLAYLDANHRYEPTLRYFESILPKLHEHSIVVIDDIHWSAEMNKAWQELKNRSEVTLSIDLFEGGLLFFNKDLKKEHHILAF